MSCCGSKQAISSPESPIVLGQNVDKTIYKVRSTINYAGMSPGQIAWVTGALVQELIELKVLVETN